MFSQVHSIPATELQPNAVVLVGTAWYVTARRLTDGHTGHDETARGGTCWYEDCLTTDQLVAVGCRWLRSFTAIPIRSDGPGEGAHRVLNKWRCRERLVGLPEGEYPEVQKQPTLVWVKMLTYTASHERYTSIL